MNGLAIGWGTGTGQAQLMVAPAAACALAGTGETAADRSTHRITRRLSRVGRAAVNGDNTREASNSEGTESRAIRDSGR